MASGTCDDSELVCRHNTEDTTDRRQEFVETSALGFNGECPLPSSEFFQYNFTISSQIVATLWPAYLPGAMIDQFI
jgi:hypothetical protein